MFEKKRKIIISTPVDYDNYGNRLQNYATHMICKKYGLEAVTIGVEDKYYFKIIPKHLMLNLIDVLHIGGWPRLNKKYSSLYKSYLAWRFTKRYMRTIYYDKHRDISTLGVDYVGIGGDQIWSPYWHERIPFCNFVNFDSKKKICFAPSFGSDDLPDDYLQIIKQELSTIENIAIREKSGQEIIKKMLGVEAYLVVDPVLLLDKTEWEYSILQEKCSVPDKKYMLIYFLEKKESYIEKWILEEAENQNLIILDLSRNDKGYDIVESPLGFVNLISKSEWVMTDSFHGAMFALMFNRNLVLFNRHSSQYDMSTRLRNISQLYGLEKCWFCKDKKIEEYEYDKRKALAIIKTYIDSTLVYIQRVLKQ